MMNVPDYIKMKILDFFFKKPTYDHFLAGWCHETVNE